jgi:recombination protein RecR
MTDSPSLLLPAPMADLVAALGKLPGIGPRSAERLALHLLQTDERQVQDLARILVSARERIRTCERCGGLTEAQPCRVCSNPARDGSQVCVVEKPVDLLLFEKAGTYRGLYHVLGGKLSPLQGTEPEDLTITALESRLAAEPIREVILALPTDVEGDATSSYLARRLGGRPVRVSRLAHGLPAGSTLEFADELTLSRALQGRQPWPG